MSVVADYLKVITSEHADKPNFISTLTSYLNVLQDAEICLNTFDSKFSLELAEGAQQDVLGNILNVSRTLQFTSSGTGVLSDADYYLILSGQVLKSSWDGSIEDLYNIWDSMFPEYPILIKDNQDMTVDIYLMSGVTPLQQELLTNDMLVPKVAGVLVTYFNITEPIFSYDYEFTQVSTIYYTGYDTGAWSESV